SVFNVDAEVDGAEIEIITQPVSGLILQLGASYLDTMQLDVPVPVGGTRDFQMPMSPELTLTGMARYEWGIAIGTLFAQVDATYVDERSGSAIDSTALRFPSYTRTNASAG